MKLIFGTMKLFFREKFHRDLSKRKMGGFESPNFDFYVVNFDTMKRSFCVKTAEPLIPQGFWSIEKERKLQYQWYHNFRSYVATVDNNDTVSYGCMRVALELQPSERKMQLL